MKTLHCLPLVLLAAAAPLLHASDSKRTAEYILTTPADAAQARRFPAARIDFLAEPPTWLDMDQSIANSATSLWRHRLYRGWAGLETERTTLRLGRQRIAWGTGKLWNPTDVLNPYQPLAVEPDEE